MILACIKGTCKSHYYLECQSEVEKNVVITWYELIKQHHQSQLFDLLTD